MCLACAQLWVQFPAPQRGCKEKKTGESASYWVTAPFASPPCEDPSATPWPGHYLFIFSFPVALQVEDSTLVVFYWSAGSFSTCWATKHNSTAGLHVAHGFPGLPRCLRLLLASCSLQNNKIWIVVMMYHLSGILLRKDENINDGWTNKWKYELNCIGSSMSIIALISFIWKVL